MGPNELAVERGPGPGERQAAFAGVADGRRQRGERTRLSILELAAQVASVDGLKGLSIGRLAAELGVSKSGLFAHFGSKQQLQLETVDAAARLFEQAVWEPVAASEPGLTRLIALLDSWLDYQRRAVFAGGCFFNNVQREFDARPGAVRDRICEQSQRWSSGLVALVRSAQKRGQLSADVDPAQIAFELDAVGVLAGSRYQLHDDASAFDQAAGAFQRILNSVATPEGLALLQSRASPTV